VTLTRTRVPEHRAVHWLEFPFVATIFQRQDEDARDRSARLAIRPRPNERSQGSAPVPTTNCRRPRTGSGTPLGSCGPKRS
jgi:hypothetical protein